MTTRPTIYDVAAAAGVAPSTVSRALARPGQVRTRTAERVRSAAESLGYRTSTVGPSQARRSTDIVLLVTSDIANPFAAELIHGADDVAFGAGLAIAVADSQESGRRERTVVERALPRVDAVVLASSRLSDSAIRMIAKQKPTVVLNRSVRDVASVFTTYRSAAEDTMGHLRDLGHDAADYVAGPSASWADGSRWRALLESARGHGVGLRRAGPTEPTVDGGARFAETLSARPPTALVTFNDQIAAGVVQSLAAASTRVPSDISVISFDDSVLAGLIVPNLTTIATPLRTMGGEAISIVLALLGGTDDVPHVEMPAALTVRDSTGPRRHHLAL